jgi:hypothetical protein
VQFVEGVAAGKGWGVAVYDLPLEAVWRAVNDEEVYEDLGTPLAERAERGRPVDWTRGSWLVVGLADGRTVAEYFAWTDPGGMIPARPASRFARGAIRDTLDAIGRLAQSYSETTLISTAE